MLLMLDEHQYQKHLTSTTSSHQNTKMDDRYKNRHQVILALFILGTLILLLKAMQLQVFDNKYKTQGENIAVEQITTFPSRGLIYDRNKKLIVYNDALYDLMVTYNQINPEMDTAKFCRLLEIDKPTFKKLLEKNWRSGRYSKRKPFIFLSKISARKFTQIQESLYAFPGFTPRLRNVRGYPHPYAAHLLGNLREANMREIENDTTKFYQLGDYKGDSGLESSYEDQLRGEKGVRYILKDKFGREVEPFNDGKSDKPPVSGKDLISTIDIDLQGYCEKLMQNKRGSVVIIEPKSGEILSMLSAPTYDPKSLAIGNSERGNNLKKMYEDPLEPFFDRSVMSKYPPGSIFKTIVGLVAMEEEIISASNKLICKGGYRPGGPGSKEFKCHRHETQVDIAKSLQHSCNTYYWRVFRDIVDQYGESLPNRGLAIFSDYLDKFGIGTQLEVDYPREGKGHNPSPAYYDKRYGKGKWKSGHIQSVGIGQGEIEMTTLQMANLAAIIANKGSFYIPHLAKSFSDTTQIDERFKELRNVGIASYHFNSVIEGMERVVKYGTAQNALIPDISICGKTGTSQNAGKDHSIFMAFAPQENPQIALAVYIENGGFGATYAAPIASLIIEKYLEGEIREEYRNRLEKKMMEADLIKEP